MPGRPAEDPRSAVRRPGLDRLVVEAPRRDRAPHAPINRLSPSSRASNELAGSVDSRASPGSAAGRTALPHIVSLGLESTWEESLRTYSRIKEDHRRHLEQQPTVLTAEERRAISRLAGDAPALWHAETTTNADRKAILRLLVDEVVATVEGQTEWLQVTIRWAGGHETRHRIVRPVSKMSQLARYEEWQARIIELRARSSAGTRRGAQS